MSNWKGIDTSVQGINRRQASRQSSFRHRRTDRRKNRGKLHCTLSIIGLTIWNTIEDTRGGLVKKMNQGQPVPFRGIARLWRDRQTWLAKSKLTYMLNNKESISGRINKPIHKSQMKLVAALVNGHCAACLLSSITDLLTLLQMGLE